MTFNDPLFYLALISAYLIGSVPTGYILLKIFYNRDITKEGSGNVGTLNAFKVSRSKLITLIVLILDFLKGFIPVLILIHFNLFPLPNILLCSLFLILGHNFPVWLNFKGGRGLATAAGIYAILNAFIIAGWCVVWVIIFSIRKDVLLSNFIATLLLPLITVVCLLFDLHSIYLENVLINRMEFILFTIVLTSLILIRHSEVFIKLIQFKTSKANR